MAADHREGYRVRVRVSGARVCDPMAFKIKVRAK